MGSGNESRKQFDFGVITYNQQDVVIETLESIKYQILRYGTEYKCRLIIGDDGSTDNTIRLCERWVNNNKDLFTFSTILKPKENRGTVQNYLNVFSLITSSFFKIMDGDDIFSSQNIFELYERIPENEVFTCVPLGIDKNGAYRDVINDYWYFSKQENNKLIQIMKYQNIFLSGSTFIRKEMIINNTIKFMNRFRLLEDHSMFYEIIMRIKPSISFLDTPYIIYRVRDASVSHSMMVNKMYAEDCERMCCFMKNNADGLYSKLHLCLAGFSYKVRFRYFQPIRFFGKVILYYRKIVSRRYRRKLSQSAIAKELNYYNLIREQAKEFIECI